MIWKRPHDLTLGETVVRGIDQHGVERGEIVPPHEDGVIDFRTITSAISEKIRPAEIEA